MCIPPSVVTVSPWDVAELRLVNPLQWEHQNAQRSAHFCCWLHFQRGDFGMCFPGKNPLHHDPPSLLLPDSALTTAGGWLVCPLSSALLPTGSCFGPVPMHPHPWLKPEDPQGFSPSIQEVESLGPSQRVLEGLPRVQPGSAACSRGLQAGSQSQSNLVHAGSQLPGAQLGLEILLAFISSVWSCVLPRPISMCLEDTRARLRPSTPRAAPPRPCPKGLLLLFMQGHRRDPTYKAGWGVPAGTCIIPG